MKKKVKEIDEDYGIIDEIFARHPQKELEFKEE